MRNTVKSLPLGLVLTAAAAYAQSSALPAPASVSIVDHASSRIGHAFATSLRAELLRQYNVVLADDSQYNVRITSDAHPFVQSLVSVRVTAKGSATAIYSHEQECSQPAYCAQFIEGEIHRLLTMQHAPYKITDNEARLYLEHRAAQDTAPAPTMTAR